MSIQKAVPGTYPVHAHTLPDAVVEEGRYRIDFARNEAQLEEAQRLRFEVFNLELQEGLEASFQTGLDQDRFDRFCHHLLVRDTRDGAVVGTYRMQTGEMAAEYEGFYSAEEFDFSHLPLEIVRESVEVGRACVAKEHRNRMVLFLLWKGLARYMAGTRKRYLFGCCSLTSQDPVEGKRVMEYLEANGFVMPDLTVPTNPDWRCYEPGFELPADAPTDEVELPRLFRTYLRYGAKVCSDPALDREFKTIDYLVLLDLQNLDDASRAMFFGDRGSR